jgi:hypothetical protein
LKEPPADLLLNFTQNGDMPITRWFYFNEATQSTNEDITEVITNQEIENWRVKVRRGDPLHYDEIKLRDLMYKYSQYIKNQNIAIL